MDVDTSNIGSDVRFYHYVGDFFNILKAFIGTNYQAVPFAFKNSGLLFGILGVFGIAALTDHCCQLMIRCKYYVIDQVLEEETFKGQLSEDELCDLRVKLRRTLGYGDIGKKVFGIWCYHLIQVAVWFTQFTTCMAYFIFIGNTVFELFPRIPVPADINNNTRPLYLTDHSSYGIPMLDIHFINQQINDAKLQDQSRVQNFPIQMIQEHEYNSKNQVIQSNVIEKNSTIHSKNVKSYSESHAQARTKSFESGFIHEVMNSTAASIIPPKSCSHLPSVPPTAHMQWINAAPDLKLVVLFPLPFFLITSIIKKIRLIAPFSAVATLFLGIGAVSVFAFLLHGFSLFSGGFHWVRFSTLPLFVGQLISAYEGIGCIIPIESSMDGNRWIFPGFLRTAVYVVFLILCSFGIVGYLRYGTSVEQIIVLNMVQHTPLSVFVDVTLVLSVLFTYPLQCFPTIEITETYVFSFFSIFSSKRRSELLEHDEINSGRRNIQDEETGSDNGGLIESFKSVDSVHSKASVNMVQTSVPNWQRNALRIFLTLVIVALSILCRNVYAYLSAFTGAVGCSLLAYIIPCAVHLKVKWDILSDENKVKDILIIAFSVLASILTLVSIFQAFASGGDI